MDRNHNGRNKRPLLDGGDGYSARDHKKPKTRDFLVNPPFQSPRGTILLFLPSVSNVSQNSGSKIQHGLSESNGVNRHKFSGGGGGSSKNSHPKRDHVQRPKAQDSHEVSQSSNNLPPLPPIEDPALLSAVFTHVTHISGHISTKLHTTYDRLEFLGDAYIELLASRLVFALYPDLPTGRLSQQRELLIKNETLAEYAIAYGFEQRIQIADGLLSGTGTGGDTNQKKMRTKILGDVFEAYIAGIVLSAEKTNKKNTNKDGFLIAETFLHALWKATKLSQQSSLETRRAPDPQSKVELAKLLMHHRNGNPIKIQYREEQPPDHRQKSQGKVWFHVACFLTGWGYEDFRLGGGVGLSISEAGMSAAEDALGNEVTRKAAEMKKVYMRKIQEEKEREERENEGKGYGGDKKEAGKEVKGGVGHKEKKGGSSAEKDGSKDDISEGEISDDNDDANSSSESSE